jgi:hypothetical protein
MAKLSAHGHEVGRIESLACTTAVMSDGNILRNYGDGWKLYRKIKPGFTPEQAYERRVENQRKFLEERPAWAELKRLVHAAACQSKRGTLISALQLLGGDVDGLWSELNESWGADLNLDLAECEELARAYQASVVESNEIRARAGRLQELVEA